MANDDVDQDALAAEWAASLGEDDDDSPPAAAAPAAADSGGMNEEEALAAEWAAALAADEQDSVKKEKEQHALSAQAKVVEFKDMTDEAKAPRQDSRRELDFILDIPLDVSAELGRTRLLINELLQLGQGSVVELNKLAGEPLEVYVNGKMVARGEAVVINEKFGIRLTDIISPIERVKQLG
ncbi:flagellar motor switch protein FliN [Desulfovibrio sp. OttesenSCG-928-G11]|nr:flagellar motor switch protein FliN [Desulfovibrio sp. OttesenSCG-928-G11]